MLVINKIPENKKILLDTFYFNAEIHRLFLEKIYYPTKDTYHYFIKLYRLNPNGSNYCEAYIYFYLDERVKKSSFIGTFVKPEYRGFGLSSLLIASWIKLCLENGYYSFTCNKKQRKPFLIYLLKKYGFEIDDVKKYDKSNFTIHLYKGQDNKSKYLVFKDSQFAEKFIRSSIAQEDNYSVLTCPPADFTYLDRVLQTTIYNLDEDSGLYTLTRRKIEQYK